MIDKDTATARPFAARTHTGHVRKINEDAVLARPDLGLWVVSDGMGGHAGGDYASREVVSALDALPPGLAPTEIMHAARDALHGAHARIVAEADRREATIGATVVLLVLSEAHFMCLWVGDSRLYRLRGGEIEMISADHSVVGDWVQQGYLTWEEAEAHPDANRITRAVGVGAELEIDKRRGDVLPGDRFLLCSDGLTKYANAAVLERCLADCAVPAATDALMDLALGRGASDNVSVIVVEA